MYRCINTVYLQIWECYCTLFLLLGIIDAFEELRHGAVHDARVGLGAQHGVRFACSGSAISKHCSTNVTNYHKRFRVPLRVQGSFPQHWSKRCLPCIDLITFMLILRSDSKKRMQEINTATTKWSVRWRWWGGCLVHTQLLSFYPSKDQQNDDNKPRRHCHCN